MHMDSLTSVSSASVDQVNMVHLPKIYQCLPRKDVSTTAGVVLGEDVFLVKTEH